LRRVGLAHTQFAEATCRTIWSFWSSVPWCALASGVSSSPWHPPAPGRVGSHRLMCDGGTPQPDTNQTRHTQDTSQQRCCSGGVETTVAGQPPI